MSQKEQQTVVTTEDQMVETNTSKDTKEVAMEAQSEGTQDATEKSQSTEEHKEAPSEEKKDARGGRGDFRSRRGGGRGGRRPMRREKSEFEQKIVSLRRVTRVMAGGRRFSFSAAVVIGDQKGRVGFGMGKAVDTSLAIDKAVRMAKKNMITIKRTETNSIPHDSQAKYKASEVLLRPVSGKGLAAGGAVRVVLELAGIDEVGGKLISRSKNNINNAKATLQALQTFTVNTPKNG